MKTLLAPLSPAVRCWVGGTGPYAAVLFAARPDARLGGLAEELTDHGAYLVPEAGGWVTGADVSFLPPVGFRSFDPGRESPPTEQESTR